MDFRDYFNWGKIKKAGKGIIHNAQIHVCIFIFNSRTALQDYFNKKEIKAGNLALIFILITIAISLLGIAAWGILGMFGITIPKIVVDIITKVFLIDLCSILLISLSIELIEKLKGSDWYRRSHPQYGTHPPQKENVQYEYVSSDERFKEERREKERRDKLRNDNFAEVIAMVMKADGITSKTEGKAVRKYLNKHRLGSIATKINFKLKNGTTHTMKESCIGLAAHMSDAERLGFIEFLFDIARLCKGIDQAEWRLLSEIMEYMELQNVEIEYLEHKYSHFYKSVGGKRNAGQETSNEISTNVSSAKSTNPALRVLGLDDSATEEEIQTAYHRLAKKYHPDTVQDEKMKLILTEKFKEINLAYDILTK